MAVKTISVADLVAIRGDVAYVNVELDDGTKFGQAVDLTGVETQDDAVMKIKKAISRPIVEDKKKAKPKLDLSALLNKTIPGVAKRKIDDDTGVDPDDPVMVAEAVKP